MKNTAIPAKFMDNCIPSQAYAQNKTSIKTVGFN